MAETNPVEFGCTTGIRQMGTMPTVTMEQKWERISVHNGLSERLTVPLVELVWFSLHIYCMRA